MTTEFTGDPLDNLAQSLRAAIASEVERALQAKPEFAKVLSVMEVAEVLHVSETTVRNLIREGTLPARHVRGRTVVRRADLERYLEGAA